MSELRGRHLHFANGRAATNALVAKVGRTDTVGLKQEGFGVSEATGRGQLGAVAGGPHPAEQAGFGATF